MSAQLKPEDLASMLKTSIPTPINGCSPHLSLSKEDKIEAIAKHFEAILDILGLDLTNDSLKKTPQRIAKMYVKEIFSGLTEDTFPEISLMSDCLSKCQDEQVVFVRDITLTSFCEHHFLPFVGKAHFAYIPNGKVIGLSKINRIIEFFSKRPQIQERLTVQVADCLSNILDTDHVAIRVEAKHSCVALRGICDHQSGTVTQILRGQFHRDPSMFQAYL